MRVATSSSRFFLCLSVVLGAGCLPDLGPWQVVRGVTTDGAGPGTDAGPPGVINPIDLGLPCPNPHMVVSTTGGDPARIIRVEPGTNVQCRTSELLEVQRDFGDNIFDVDWHTEVGEILGLSSSVLGLDAEGFPRWRYQRFEDSSFNGQLLVPSGRGSAMRIGVFWQSTGSDLSDGVLLDSEGNATSDDIELPFSGIDFVAAHPDGSGRFIMGNRFNALSIYTLSDSIISFETSDGTPLFSADPDFNTLFGNRRHLAADLTLGLLTMTHEDGIVIWSSGGAAPTTAMTCPLLCDNYHHAVAGPSGDAYTICSKDSRSHLVHMGGASCTIVIDGTSLGSRSISELVLAHAPL